ncbi:hypothetical protein U6J36_11595 [Cutibacterium acnes]|nr:hypothetical protein HMPREF1299_01391 [Propionibacterium sp. KPL2003]
MHSHGEETPEEEISPPQQVIQRVGALAPQDTVLGMVRQRQNLFF